MSKFLLIVAVAGVGTLRSECLAAEAPSRRTIIQDVMVIDGLGREPYGPVDVEIADGKINRIGAVASARQAQTGKVDAPQMIDGGGKTLVPGFIDCHAHLASVPGALARGDDRQSIRAQQLLQMKTYLAAGVTTVLDTAATPSLIANVEEFSKQRKLPRFFGLAPFLTPVGGYMASSAARGELFRDLDEAVATPEDVDARITRARPLRPFGVKVTEEYGFGPFQVWPAFSDTMRAAIVERAREAGLPILVHSEREEGFWNALKLKPYAFVHGGFFDETPSPEVIGKIHESQAYVVGTLGIFKMMNLMWNRELFNDPWFKRLVPANQIATALDPAITKLVIEAMAEQNRPWFAPKFLARWLAPLFINEQSNRAQLQSSQRAVELMFRAGIPIVMGADAGNWPVLTTMFHGVGSILDMEALMEAGLSPTETIQASTSRAATMLKIQDFVGSIEEGKIADLVLLGSSPLKNNLAFRDVELVFKDGVAKSPSDWLAQ